MSKPLYEALEELGDALRDLWDEIVEGLRIGDVVRWLDNWLRRRGL